MEEIVGTFVGRWYVTAYRTVFVVLALRHLGLRNPLAAGLFRAFGRQN